MDAAVESDTDLFLLMCLLNPTILSFHAEDKSSGILLQTRQSKMNARSANTLSTLRLRVKSPPSNSVTSTEDEGVAPIEYGYPELDFGL
jgi:hypothetical protein